MTEHLRILSIGAHPADVFDQSGGTMAHHTARGDYVGCVALTHGLRTHDKVITNSMYEREEIPDEAELKELIAERIAVKENEVRRACEILGVEDLYFFQEDDAVFFPTEENVRRLARLIRELRPDIVLTHLYNERDGVTQQHAIAGQIAMYALQLASVVDFGDRNPPHYVKQVFFYGQGGATIPATLWDAEGGYYNDVFIDITDVIDKKLAALDCMVSQGDSGPLARKRIEFADGAFGAYGGNCSYAEGFISLRAETHYYLPLTNEMIAFAQASDHEKKALRAYRLPVD